LRRRRFLHGTLAATAATPATSAFAQAASPVSPSVDWDLSGRVKRAMLSMQRASWEQGVAAQAFLELGDDTQAFFLLMEAAHAALGPLPSNGKERL
jgi:hypothetical protein